MKIELEFDAEEVSIKAWSKVATVTLEGVEEYALVNVVMETKESLRREIWENLNEEFAKE